MFFKSPDYIFEAFIPKHIEILAYKETWITSAYADIKINGERLKSIGFRERDIEHYRGLMAILNDSSLDNLSPEEMQYVKSNEYSEIGDILYCFFSANYKGNCLTDLYAKKAGKSLYFCESRSIKGEWKTVSVFNVSFNERANKLAFEYYDHDKDRMETVFYDVPPYFIKCVKAGIKKQCIKELNSTYPSLVILSTPIISHY